MSGPLVVGIDGGGSKTLVALADRSGSVVRMARGGGVNPMDNSGWLAALTAVVAAAGIGTTVERSTLVQVTAALPAYGEAAAVSRALKGAIADLFGPVPAHILNDVDGAHIGAFAGGPGILILSGSGSMAWARDAGGRSCRVGGWGDAIGDEGSAYWIGARAIGLVSQALDGRADASDLAAAIFAHLGLDLADPQESLSGWVVGLAHPRSEIAALAEPVAALAAAGDPSAIAIMAAAADELARHVTAIARQVPGGEALPWSHAGGTFRSATLLNALIHRIGRPPLSPRLPPIGGALLDAATRAGWPVDAGWTDRLATALEAGSTTSPPVTTPKTTPETTPTTTQPTSSPEQGDLRHA